MRAMVIGADGTIGRALVAALVDGDADVIATSRRPGALARGQIYLDFLAPDLEAMPLPRADVAFFCAAITGFTACRQNGVLAHRINVAVPSALAYRLAAA